MVVQAPSTITSISPASGLRPPKEMRAVGATRAMLLTGWKVPLTKRHVVLLGSNEARAVGEEPTTETLSCGPTVEGAGVGVGVPA